jgi:phage baseplate assembly protein W
MPASWTLQPEQAAQQNAADGSLVARGAPLFLTRGIITPFRRDEKSDFANDDDVDVVRSNVEQVLGTMARSETGVGGELPWRTEFGSLMHLARHRNNNVVLQEILRSYVTSALARWETRARVTDVQVSSSGRALRAQVLFNVVDRSGNVIARDQRAQLPLLSK